MKGNNKMEKKQEEVKTQEVKSGGFLKGLFLLGIGLLVGTSMGASALNDPTQVGRALRSFRK